MHCLDKSREKQGIVGKQKQKRAVMSRRHHLLVCWVASMHHLLLIGSMVGCGGFVIVDQRRPSVGNRRSNTLLSMGGYYSEPETTQLQDQSTVNTHMVFGKRCRERTVALYPGEGDATTITVTVLQPINESEPDNEENNRAWSEWVLQREIDLAQYLLGVMYSEEGSSPHSIAVLEEGPYRTGLVTLALLQQQQRQQQSGWGDALPAVTAISSQLDRLQIMQASHLFHETTGGSSSLQSAHWINNDMSTLPQADVLVVMFLDDDTEYRDYYLQQWLHQYPCIVYMTATDGQIHVIYA